jgi:hypothetical protein
MKATVLFCLMFFIGVGLIPFTAVSQAAKPDTTFGVFTEITPQDSLFVTPPDEDFWVISTAPADYDNDGDLDLVTGTDGTTVIYRNDTPGQNEAPLTPAGLNVTQLPDNTALLSWLPGVDDHTPGAALTYDLEVYLNDIPVSIPKRTPEEVQVTLKVYNTQGVEVKSLVSGTIKAGNYEVTFNANTLPQGISDYTMKAGVHSLSKKVVISGGNVFLNTTSYISITNSKMNRL